MRGILAAVSMLVVALVGILAIANVLQHVAVSNSPQSQEQFVVAEPALRGPMTPASATAPSRRELGFKERLVSQFRQLTASRSDD